MAARSLGRSWALGALTALTAALAGCGQSSSARTPDLASLPLVRGASVVAKVKDCDRGASSFCAWELVLVDRRFKSSLDLLNGEHRLLRKSGWSGANGDTGEQHAADSPGHKLRVTYATAYGDLKGIDLGWIQRPRAITLALSRALFDRAAALSVMLETGPA
jgi:hypothetical protein